MVLEWLLAHEGCSTRMTQQERPDRAWTGSGPQDGVGATVDAVDGGPSDPVVLIGAPFELDESESTHAEASRGRVWRVAADTPAGALEEVAPVSYVGTESGSGDFAFFADLDDDGGLDVVVSDSDPDGRVRASVYDAGRRGPVPRSASWGSVEVPDGTGHFELEDCGDLDHDGTSDLCAVVDDTASLLFGPFPHGDRSVADDSGSVRDVSWFRGGQDIDGDGADDLVALLEDGTGFALLTEARVGANALDGAPTWQVAGYGLRVLADVDGDGRGDILYDHSVYVDKDGGEQGDARWTLGAGDRLIRGSESADLDGDGHPDLVLSTWQQGAPDEVLVFLGPLSAGVAAPEDASLTMSWPSVTTAGLSITCADVDRDGRADLVVGHPHDDGGGTVELYLGSSLFPPS